MKRFLCVCLVLLTLASLAGCGFRVQDWKEYREEQWTSDFDLQIVTQAPKTEAPEQNQPSEAGKSDPATEAPAPETKPAEPGLTVTEDGVYDSKEEVALYIHLYRHLPSNYITKKDAEKLGWPGGELDPYAPGKCIGGSHFGNYEGLLPDAPGRSWTECDIDTLGAKKRGAKRIIFSNDGLIYYTGDHYEHFELLYDGWED